MAEDDLQRWIALFRARGIQGTNSEYERWIGHLVHENDLLHRLADVLSEQPMPHIHSATNPIVVDELFARLNKDDIQRYSYRLGGYREYGYGDRRYQTGVELNTIVLKYLTPEDYRYTETAYHAALYMLDGGDLDRAEKQLRALAFPAQQPERFYIHRDFPIRQSLSETLRQRGRLPEAEHWMNVMIQWIEAELQHHARDAVFYLALCEREFIKDVSTSGINLYAARAAVRTLRGNVAGAFADFKQAELFGQRKRAQVAGSQIYNRWETGTNPTITAPSSQFLRAYFNKPDFILKGVWLNGDAGMAYTHLLIRLGKLKTAQRWLNQLYTNLPTDIFPALRARIQLAYSDVARLMGDTASAQTWLAQATIWANDHHYPEIQCAASLSAARLTWAHNDVENAHQQAQLALEQARQHGYALVEIDACVLLGRIAFSLSDLSEAQKWATRAAGMAEHPDCDYLWGQSSAAHLSGEVYRRHQLHNPAHTYLKRAAHLREHSRDPRLPNTLDLLAQLPPASKP
jgi:hypothetical protein